MNRILAFLLFTSLAASAHAQNVVKEVVRFQNADQNLLRPDGFHPYEAGFESADGVFLCDNGSDISARRGVAQTVTLHQSRPEPIVAEAWSRAENVSGSPSADYAIYIDLIYDDGTPLWGRTADFAVGTHDWQKKTLTILPEKPVRSLTMYALFRNKSGKAEFRDMKLSVLSTPENTCLFDGVPVIPKGLATLQIRDVAANSDYVELRKNPFGVFSTVKTEGPFTQVTLTNSDDEDRCLTLIYAVVIPPADRLWCEHPRSDSAIKPNTEYTLAGQMANVGSNGRLSLYPFAAVAGTRQGGDGVGIDLKTPAFFRTGYNSGTSELFVAVDLALTKESPTATIRFVRFSFAAKHKFRGALYSWYRLFPSDFACRTPEQGIWMPFAAISQVPNHEDFGFQFKEGDDETAWDDTHDILTFRYTEPGTWWMPILPEMPQNYDSAISEAKRLADAGNAHALALFKSGMHDAEGKFVCQILDTPWCTGAVWSTNDLPGIDGGSFSLKWSPEIYQSKHERKDRGILDGEYVDSAEAYVTAMLDFRRKHFSAAQTPLVFSMDERKPAIYKGLMLFEYVRKIAGDMRQNEKLTFANSTPDRLCWLAPWLDIMGMETDWNHGGHWNPTPDAAMLYRRAMCGPKPYCFLMNTEFTRFSYDMSERFMARSLAYGMFPGYFSADASTDHYFTRPELYERDRPLFKKYIPLCKRVAEAGWQPLTRATSCEPTIYVERFGSGAAKTYFTVFNDSLETKTTVLRFEDAYTAFKDLVSGKTETVAGGELRLTLPPEGVAVLEPAE